MLAELVGPKDARRVVIEPKCDPLLRLGTLRPAKRDEERRILRLRN